MRTVLASTLAVVLGCSTVALAGPFANMFAPKPVDSKAAAAKSAAAKPTAKPVITQTAHQEPVGAPLLTNAELVAEPAAPAAPAAPEKAAAPAPVVVEVKGGGCCAPANACCTPAKTCCAPAKACCANECSDCCGKPARPKRNCFECGDYCEIVKLWLWEIGQCFHSGCK